MAYPPPPQNPYGQQQPPYQQPPYQQPPYGQPPPYGYPPQYPYQPPRNNSGAIIAVLVLILVIAGGVVAFLLLSNQGKCNPSELAGTWYYNVGGIEDRLTIRGSTMTSVSNITGTVSSTFSCRGDTMIVTGNLGGTVTTVEFEIVSLNSRELTFSALGQTLTYRRQ